MTTVLPILIPKTNNILLLKDEIGRAKPSTRKLPDSSFSYGKQIQRDPFQILQIDSPENIRSNHRTNRTEINLIVHGKKNKPSTPFDKIMRHYYASEAREQLNKIYQERIQTEPRAPSFNKNKSFSLRYQFNTKKEEKKMFKLQQFQDIKSRVFQQYHNLIL